ncbi:pyrroline-5-carboxylate reductase [Propionibacterium australiense]|uniref:Pyrroline-5-carboxylate reductase n=1 Tax=Propionibacterium australiense TaxID=119981 RepID=A0A383S5K7_9ACTN|nr:pyrroline-5-carboxylate reductase [Propionibacterium australiense]RLP09727.1 pyrroline-5-carboxylate reductase [Propionibacterium australiense]RLP10216.1 pyrroline-5-carboxylate reductase [Propionibacterium australiense]SYZ33197.1 pyrroline-5-carboxylate reductase [Propionibacterium australiense]VEH89345.1 Pyrroline-5-carboxylate reductase [Propionibacterium australiense]
MTSAQETRAGEAGGPPRLGFLGAGTMGGTVAAGLVASGHPGELIGVTSRTPDTRERLAERLGVRPFETNTGAAAWADVVVIGVKPHAAGGLLDEVRTQVGDQKLVISLCAGLATTALESHLEPGARVVRVMPNTPSAVGAGMAGISAGSCATQGDLDLAVALMSAVGRAVVVPESQQNALAALSGSGPAWVFYGVEALIESGVAQGLPRSLATELVVQTVRGSAQLLAETGQHPSLAREAVTSPGGTTAAGLRVLDQRAVRAAVVDAVDACVRRAGELG